jgi:hypothetical protein
MFPTVDDAAYIYARACLAWYGGDASGVARSKIAEMKRVGDRSGVTMWEKVESEIGRLGGSRVH